MKTKRHSVDIFYGIGFGFDKIIIKSENYIYDIYSLTFLFIKFGLCVKYKK